MPFSSIHPTQVIGDELEPDIYTPIQFRLVEIYPKSQDNVIPITAGIRYCIHPDVFTAGNLILRAVITCALTADTTTIEVFPSGENASGLYYSYIATESDVLAGEIVFTATAKIYEKDSGIYLDTLTATFIYKNKE